MHGAILETDLNGKPLRRWDADAQGRSFYGGINDLVTTPNGGAYATIFGPFDKQPTVIIGAVVYKAPGSDAWIRVADNINYANGVGVSPDQKTLYVSEMAYNSVIKFTVKPDGTLTDRSNFAVLSALIPNKSASPWLGPDSFKVDRKGNLYVAQFYGGRILKISPEGKLLHVFDIAAGDGTTNVAFSADERDLYVTVVIKGDDAFGEAKGEVVKIPNVE